MNFLLDAPSHISFIRGMDWRINAVPGTMTLNLHTEGDACGIANGPAPGSHCNLCFEAGERFPATGSLLFFLPFEFMQQIPPEQLFQIDSGEWRWNWPLLEVQLPFRSLTLLEFPVPQQPGPVIFEFYYRSTRDEFFRLPEIRFEVPDQPATSLQVRLSSNFAGGRLRYSIVAEQGEWQRFMADSHCREEVILECGGQTHTLQLENGVAIGSLPLPSETKPFSAKVFHITLENGESNVVDPGFAADLGGGLYWGDMHVHSRESDGSGEPEDVLVRARDWQKLDFMAFNEHIENSLSWRIWTRAKWQKLQRLYDNSTVNGEFVVIPGFEFRSYCNLWCFSNAYLDYLGPEINLDEARREVNCHHERWNEQEAEHQRKIAEFAADPDWLVGYHRLELLKDLLGYLPTPVQLLQVAHYKRPPEVGSMDYLKRGDRVAFFGSTDTHLGMPGTGFRGGREAASGLTAIYADELSRRGLHEALKKRRTYATMGSRTLLDARLNGSPMGSESTVADGGDCDFTVRAVGRERLARLDIVLDGETQTTVPLNGKRHVDYTWHGVKAGSQTDFIFARLHLEDGRMVWNSPIWFD